jgi:hypothetical protein
MSVAPIATAQLRLLQTRLRNSAGEGVDQWETWAGQGCLLVPVDW